MFLAVMEKLFREEGIVALPRWELADRTNSEVGRGASVRVVRKCLEAAERLRLTADMILLEETTILIFQA